MTVVARREFQAGRHAAALSGLDTLLQIEPDDVSAVDALFLKAEVFRELNRLPDERAAYSEILRRFPENPRSVEAQFPRVPLPNTPSGRSGACTGKPTNSNWRLRLTELGTRFPQTQWDAWWAAGELLEEKIKDNARARKAYSKVPESSRNYQRAQRKLSRLRP